MQDYSALAAIWPSLSGANDFEKLQTLNAAPEGESPWPQEHGWMGPINQNDLVAAGIITNVQRIDLEVANGLLSQDRANEEKEWDAALSAEPDPAAATLKARELEALSGDD